MRCPNKHAHEEEAMKAAKLGSENVIWDLSALYASLGDPRIAHDMKAVRRDAAALATEYRGRVAAGKISPAELRKFMVEEERISSATGRLGEYAELMLTTDNLDEGAKSLVMKMQELGSGISNTLVFFPIEPVSYTHLRAH